jgi:hypothetical protein
MALTKRLFAKFFVWKNLETWGKTHKKKNHTRNKLLFSFPKIFVRRFLFLHYFFTKIIPLIFPCTGLYGLKSPTQRRTESMNLLNL